MSVLLCLPTKYVGNMTIALRTLSCALESLPDATLLIDDAFEDLVRLCLPDAHLIAYPRSRLSRSSALSRVRTYLGFIRQLRQRQYDRILDFDGTVVSARLVRLARARHRAGPSFAKRPGIYDQLIAIRRESQHCFDDYVQMAAEADVSVSPQTYLPIPAARGGSSVEANLPAESVIQNLGIRPGQPYVCIHPSATKDYKQWSIQGFCDLAEWFLEQGLQVVVIGAGASEIERVQMIDQATGHRIINAHDRVSLFDLISVLQGAALFVGNDSGPMHYAAACGCHVFAIFGPTELIRWEPKVESHTIIRGPAPCDPACQPEACRRNYQCMTSLEVTHVTAAISGILESRR